MTEKALKIVVIGGVACGPKAAARARRVNPDAEITVVEKGRYVSYAGCGLPYYIAGAVPELEGLMTTSSGALRDPGFFEKNKAIRVLLGTEAQQIDRENKQVKVKNLETGDTDTLDYDKLVVATGAEPIVPPIEGMELEKVYKLRNPEDAQTLREKIEAGEAERICLVGAGRVGLETLDAFEAQAVDATVVELTDQVLPTLLDPEMADYVTTELKKNINLLLEEKVLKLEGDSNGAVNKVVTDKREIEVDAVLVGVGVKPNVELAKNAGLELGPTGAVAVDEHMLTSDPDIYAGGDCAECNHLVTGNKVYNPLGSVANRHGRVIGSNAAGLDETFPGVLGTSVLKTLGTNIAKTGLSETEVREMGYKVHTSLIPAGDKSHFFPGGKYVLLKLVADAGSRKVLGAQAVGPGDVVRQIDTVATAITFGATADRVANLDLCYAPPFGSAISNVAHSANAVRNKMDGLVSGISAKELLEKIKKGEDFVLLDIRKPGEAEKATVNLKDTLFIQQEELKDKTSELPADKDIVVGCQVGVRAYDSARAVLSKSGCKQIKVLDGGWHVWFGCGYDE